jgi:hypothetical protein
MPLLKAMGTSSNELRAQIGSTLSVGEEPNTDPFAHETEARENILAGEYQTLDSIVLSGDEVLELRNQTVVVNGDISSATTRDWWLKIRTFCGTINTFANMWGD